MSINIILRGACMSDFRIEMGRRMKEQRKLLHFTQEHMAEKLSISIKHYGGVERGLAGLSLENLVEVSEILGVGLDYLVKGINETDDCMPSRIKEIYINCPREKRKYLVELLETVNKFNN